MNRNRLLAWSFAFLACLTASALSFEVDGIKYSTTDGGVNVTGYNSDYTGNLVLNGTVTYDGTEYDVVSIGGSAFANCSKSILLGDLPACTSIGNQAFYKCAGLSSVGNLSSCRSIGESAFLGCIALTCVGDLSSCLTLYKGAFQSCDNLTTIGSLSSCTRIVSSAFMGDEKLLSVNLSACTKIEPYTFYNCNNITSVGDLSRCTLIENDAFYKCEKLYNVDLSACTKIGSNAFSGCKSLTNVGNLSACTSIEYNAFNDCASLASVGELSACISIGNRAFYRCKSLTCVGDLLACSSIGSGTFYGCTSLDKIVLPGEVSPTLAEVLPSNIIVFVPASLLDTYRTADVWKDMPSYQILAFGTTTDYDIEVTAQNSSSAVHQAIGEMNLDNVINLKLSGTINGYDIMVLRNKMHNLQNLDMTDVNIVANDYEYYTGNHTEDNVLGTNSFNGSLCFLRSIKLPKTITEIGSKAFYQCANLSSVEIPEGACISIGSQAFYQCANLRSIEIPEGVTSISSNAFNACISLNSVTFPSTLVTIDWQAFYSCTALTSIILPDNLKTIGQNAFESCTSLAEVRIPSMIESIGNNAFASCTNLKDVYTYTLVPQNINQNTFASQTYTTGTLHVQKTSFYPYYWNTQWSQFSTLTEFEGTYSQWLINNQTDYVLDDETGVIDTEDGATGEIGAGSGLISENTDEDQEMDDIIIDDDGTTCGSLIGNGHINSNWLHFRIKVTKGKWYFFCFPFRINLNDIASEGSYVFRYYDGSIRAQQGSGGWQNLPTGTEYLEPGVGYIFQSNKGGTLNIKVRRENLNLNPGTLLANLISHIAENVQNASWNFMGNPHTSYFDMDNTGYECPITVWNGSSYEAVRPGDDDYHFRPFQAFFVQKPADVSEIAFPAEWRETYNQSQQASQAKANRRRIEGLKDARMLINLVLSDGTHSDKTRVVFNKESSTDYETSCDAAKFMTAGVPQLYSLFTNVSYAINERPLGSVELGFQAPEKGEYTLSAVRMDQPVLLHDNVMNITFDLADGDYTFNSEAGVFNKRFMLTLNGDATGIGVLKEQTGVSVMAETGGISFSGVDGNEVAIYSTGGATMASRVGNEFVPLPAGTYIVKVDNLPTKLLVR